MKLKNYFKDQKEVWMSEVDKLDIYQKIMMKNMQKSFARKRSLLHIRSFSYSLIVLFLVLGIYGVYFFKTNNISYNQGLVIQPASQFGEVNADYIAKIVDFKGNFYIEHNGKRLQTSNIQNQDTVTLPQDTQMVFYINTGTQAKVIGPAKFVLQETSNTSGSKQYKLVLSYGEFVEMKSLDKQSQDIKLSLDGVTVSPKDSASQINFQIIRNGSQHIVKNNGSKLVIINESDKKLTQLDNQQVVSVQKDDITLFATMDDFIKAAKKKEISQTFTFVSNSSENILDSVESLSEVQSISQQKEDDDTTVNTGVIQSLGKLLSQDKLVLSTDQNKQMQSQLYKGFLMTDLKNIYTYYIQGKDSSFAASYNNLEKRVIKLYALFDLDYKNSGTTALTKFTGLKTSIYSFVDQTQDKYYIPVKYYDNLYAMANWIDFISDHKYASLVGDDTLLAEQRNDIQSNLPSYLQLK